jgi:hypothetical protein
LGRRRLCIKRSVSREAAKDGIGLLRVRVRLSSDYEGDPAVSTPIEPEVEVEGDAPEEALRGLVEHTDKIAEIPSSLRRNRRPPAIRPLLKSPIIPSFRNWATRCTTPNPEQHPLSIPGTPVRLSQQEGAE